MPKEVKGAAARRPPDPSANHSEIAEWCSRQMPQLQPILTAVDEHISGELPGLQYGLKWKRAFYGLPDLGWLIELAPYDVSVNVVFFGGADFERPPPLGTSGRTRYVKLTGLADVESPELRDWIVQAGRTPGWL